MAHFFLQSQHGNQHPIHNSEGETLYGSYDTYYYKGLCITVYTRFSPLRTPMEYSASIVFNDGQNNNEWYHRSLDPVLYKQFFRRIILALNQEDIRNVIKEFNFV